MGTKNFGNIKVDVMTSDEVLTDITNRIENRKKFKLFFLNAHCFNLSQQNKEYATNLNNADYVLNDGIGVEIGAKVLGFSFKENLNGTDLTPRILALAAKNDYKVYLLGAGPGVAEKAAGNFKKQYPNIDIVGIQDGYFKDTEKVIENINNAKPDILIVALGVPYQENWISDYFSKIDAKLFMGVGAFLDFSSERVKRAPEILLKARLEWVFRLINEPTRLWKRTIIGVPLFFYYVIKSKFSSK
ncbi:WecB/TagA/CpsF family glycosyltransferase [Lederbergia wuyishanensis]|uniref:N-acetylglucosaminyldiphosphoundecaprenol N-acetyl-beta-D-mannosaminyltransferase n=1 Tax=Lederbergia wuyishanensis TaxID=1347903 RepID=A0ABU0D3C1_9BACI|nr:WecB/TagA/CpsF family glycosyltransferase [Lederbergia wuyishanensis]MCJ8007962.1 WecB/TagA/CpsF family glycosyltransferase [Lederbergia wuyishanensis]MDQ0342868.1 N-acetylglucosaminyldiphosphoundecaprenol N-acetyl-beta-D-mannosaminyltransferase [Lederbergia wuyishanensis]